MSTVMAGQQRLCLPPAPPARAVSPEESTVATFISKVWKIVEMSDFNHLVAWSDNGKTFVVRDYPKFALDVLPRYFKHNNFNSFVRQLNLYGFHKVAKPEQGAMSKSQGQTEREPVEFWHPNFRRGHPELLHLVQRRQAVPNRATAGDEKTPHLSKVMTDIHQMKGKQQDLAGVLETVRRDNDHLRHEVTALKDKHSLQERILNKIIHFLMHMVYKGQAPAQKRRLSSRLMLMDGIDEPSSKRTRSEILDLSDLSDLTDLSNMQPYDMQSPVSVLSTQSTVTPPPSPPQLRPEFSKQGPPALNVVDSSLPVPNKSIAVSSPPSSVANVTVTNSTNSNNSTATTTVDDVFPPTHQQTQRDCDFSKVSTLLPSPRSRSHAHISDHLDSHQQELDSLHNLLSGSLSVDPSIISEFINADHMPCPDYDALDTARLLESLTSDHGTEVTHESMLNQSPSSLAVSVVSHPTVPVSVSSMADAPSSQLSQHGGDFSLKDIYQYGSPQNNNSTHNATAVPDTTQEGISLDELLDQ